MSISSVRFSSDGSSIAIALDHSFSVYSVSPPQRLFFKEFVNSRITCISAQGDGTIIAFSVAPLPDSGTGEQRVYVWDNQYSEARAQLAIPGPIVNLLLSRGRLIIVGATFIEVYDVRAKCVVTQHDTAPNPCGACDALFGDSVQLIAACGREPCTVHITDLLSDVPPLVFRAHEHPIAALRFSPDMSYVATVSEKSTLVRVFDTVTGTQLSAFRRGNISACVRAMCFSPDNRLLVVVSESGTVHVFAADVRNGSPQDPPRSVAKLRIERAAVVSAVFRSPTELLVATSEGYLHVLECADREIRQKNRIFLLSH